MCIYLGINDVVGRWNHFIAITAATLACRAAMLNVHDITACICE